MRLAIILSGLIAVTSAFTTAPTFVARPQHHVLPMSSVDAADTEVPVIINGRNIDLTPSLVEYVNKRVGGPLSKLGSHGAVRECDVHLSVSKNPSVKDGHKVEITANLKGNTIRLSRESPDMYTSIDAAAHALNRKLAKNKEMRVQGWHDGKKPSEDFMDLEEEMGALDDDDDVKP